jgi:hypothetical protein
VVKTRTQPRRLVKTRTLSRRSDQVGQGDEKGATKNVFQSFMILVETITQVSWLGGEFGGPFSVSVQLRRWRKAILCREGKGRRSIVV